MCPIGMTYNQTTNDCQVSVQAPPAPPPNGGGGNARATPNDQVTPALVNNGDIKTVCGNGMIEGLEECDDRNTNNGDGCSSNCKI